MKKLMLFSVLLTLFSCRQDPIITLLDGTTEIERAFPGVEESLWSHFQLFETEGARRGLQIDLVREGITGVIERIHEDDVIGTCNYNAYRPNHVTIDLSFWNNTSELGREYVVFHELGHCYLWRPHDESAFQNGTCESIMNSGTGTCIPRYNRTSRSNYLDELFATHFRR